MAKQTKHNRVNDIYDQRSYDSRIVKQASLSVAVNWRESRNLDV